MKAISLWQPWASLVATGAKTIETRSWPTKYRGPLAIHAAKRCDDETLYQLSMWHVQGGLAPLVGKPLDVYGKTWAGIELVNLPFGAIIGVANLVDCVRTDNMTMADIAGQLPFGDFSLGRYAWIFKEFCPLDKPIPCKGKQGLWNVPDGLL
jgi:hypothetical protein